ncbi:MAG: bactofilin family protein [Terriglobales bacterium]
MAIENPRPDASHLGKTVRFKGDITGGEDIFIDGDVEGKIQFIGQIVTVGPNGNISAEVQARELVVHGKLKGNCKAQDRIEICRTGSVMGDMAMARISIQDGAFIQGRVDIRSGDATVAPSAAAHPPAVRTVPAPSGGVMAVPVGATPSPTTPQQSSLLDRK